MAVRTQTLVQLSDALVARIDERAARLGRSRSSLIREALEHYLVDESEAEIDRQIIEGYTRIPQTEEEDAWARAAATRMLAEERW